MSQTLPEPTFSRQAARVMNSASVAALPMEQQWALRDALAQASSVEDLAPHIKRLFDESIHPGIVEAEFDPAKHPRGRRGEWIRVLRDMAVNSVDRHEDFEVHRTDEARWMIRHDTQGVTLHATAENAADRIGAIEATRADAGPSIVSPGVFRAIFDGFEHRGLRAKVVDSTSASVDGVILDAADESVGVFERQVSVLDGEPSVYHEILTLDPAQQGRGFGTAFFEHSVRRYRELGVGSIRLTAAARVGGYQWARRGFDFDVSRYEVLSYELRLGHAQAEGFDEERFARAWAAWRLYQDRFLGTPFAATRHEVPGAMWDEFVGRFPTLERLEAYRDGDLSALDGTFSSPAEIAIFGREHRWVESRDPRSAGIEMWLGKRFLVGAAWRGIMKLSTP